MYVYIQFVHRVRVGVAMRRFAAQTATEVATQRANSIITHARDTYATAATREGREQTNRKPKICSRCR